MFHHLCLRAFLAAGFALCCNPPFALDARSPLPDNLHPQQGAKGVEEEPFVGIWRTTSATTSIILAIRPKGKGLFILIDAGSNAIEEVTWKDMPGGILVESLPRFRFWKGRHAAEARVEMESLPPGLTSRSMREFPRTFFMRRQTERKEPEEAKNRPLSEGWSRAALPERWDGSAGKRN